LGFISKASGRIAERAEPALRPRGKMTGASGRTNSARTCRHAPQGGLAASLRLATATASMRIADQIVLPPRSPQNAPRRSSGHSSHFRHWCRLRFPRWSVARPLPRGNGSRASTNCERPPCLFVKLLESFLLRVRQGHSISLSKAEVEAKHSHFSCIAHQDAGAPGFGVPTDRSSSQISVTPSFTDKSHEAVRACSRAAARIVPAAER